MKAVRRTPWCIMWPPISRSISVIRRNCARFEPFFHGALMFLVCGEALFDIFTRADDSGSLNRLGFDAIAGGSPFNVAIGLRRLGVEAGFFAGLSTDYLGRRLRAVLEKETVNTDHLVEFDAPTTLAMVAVGSDGSP
ncbi:Fructokinase, partial [Pseudomonas savastanoi]